MKKILRLSLLMLSVCLLVGFTSCDPKNKTQDAVVVAELTSVENAISTDREYMALHYTTDYRWYETAVVLTDYLDAESQTGAIESVENVFQVVTADDSGGDSKVFIFNHTNEGVKTITYDGFWIEDFPLNDEAIKLTFLQAYEKVMATNSPKPHSKKCVLRLPIGPKSCNAQWCFGNIQEQLWVDAVTGEVRNFNPAFEGFNGTGYGGLPLNQN